MQISYSVYTEILVGLKNTTYRVTEGTDGTVTICAVLEMGTLERSVLLTFSVLDGTATGSYPLLR